MDWQDLTRMFSRYEIVYIIYKHNKLSQEVDVTVIDQNVCQERMRQTRLYVYLLVFKFYFLVLV